MRHNEVESVECQGTPRAAYIHEPGHHAGRLLRVGTICDACWRFWSGIVKVRRTVTRTVAVETRVEPLVEPLTTA